ncbi:hypothetical protein WICPIJ_009553 [Wickerhamomyces pijperi]|uniref:Uncharacterized protein n=1 Tax=Wickerhamomyces pijperi TaxID=599730 RepID=A0A9P8PN22_WICPI|nr:hypothetical protein WICPIJ_009553 [Wickerhamomyces pijperi]
MLREILMFLNCSKSISDEIDDLTRLLYDLAGGDAEQFWLIFSERGREINFVVIFVDQVVVIFGFMCVDSKDIVLNIGIFIVVNDNIILVDITSDIALNTLGTLEMAQEIQVLDIFADPN